MAHFQSSTPRRCIKYLSYFLLVGRGTWNLGQSSSVGSCDCVIIWHVLDSN